MPKTQSKASLNLNSQFSPQKDLSGTVASAAIPQETKRRKASASRNRRQLD